MEDQEINTDEIEEELSNYVKESTDIGHFAVKLEEVIQTTCKEISGNKNPANTKVKGKTVPWWTETLNTMRKRIKALRRRHERTIDNEELREHRKTKYVKAKKEYKAAIKREK